VVVPVLASVLNLGTSLIVASILMLLQTAGLPVARILGPVHWISVAVSLVSASAAWWIIWKRYKPSLKENGQ
jgi:hypothetical protein